MSEFAGVIALDGAYDPSDALKTIAATLDGAGTAPLSYHFGDGAAFAFRQRILAPEDRLERQPAIGPGGIVSLWDGRLDNRADLIAALGLREQGGQPLPDGTLVAHAYARWGEDAAARLLGDFAWAVWDAPARTLVLARDHGRLRALFYCRTDRFLAFATGYAPLLALPGPRRAPDLGTLARMMLGAPEASSRTLYQGIEWVGSAERVTLTPSGRRSTRFWEPVEQPLLRLRDDRAYLEAARTLFETAVRDRLRTTGPVATSISGGLDSSAVAATAARLTSPGRVQGYCMVPRPDSTTRATARHYPDEAPFVRAIAAMHPNLDVEFLDQGVALGDADALIPHMHMPCISPGNLLWFTPLCRRAAQAGVTTMLDGAMGNFTFSSDGEDPMVALWRRREWFRLARLLANPAAQLRTLRRLAGGVRARLVPGAQTGALDFASIDPDFARAHALDAVFDRDGVRTLARQLGNPAEVLRYMLARTRAQMEQGAAIRRLHGITRSDPFGDRRVIEFALSLPPEQFRRGGVARSFARRVFADRLPTMVTANRRRGLQDTEWHWRLHTQRDRLEEAIDRLDRSELARGMLDVPRLRRLLHALPADPDDAARDRHVYGRQLELALHIGQFLVWTESGMARPNSPAFP